MNFKPILFSTPMVKAIFLGEKTQTRRKKGLDDMNEFPPSYMYHGLINDKYHFSDLDTLDDIELSCPYGTVGDVLWVRETWAPLLVKHGYIAYKADDYNMIEAHIKRMLFENKWKPSIFMPKEACRIFLKITSIRVERLHHISDVDAIKEGCIALSPVKCFEALWISLNGKDSWNLNPWVWVIDFERIEKPLNFK